jgi:hypothetical protein
MPSIPSPNPESTYTLLLAVGSYHTAAELFRKMNFFVFYVPLSGPIEVFDLLRNQKYTWLLNYHSKSGI